MVLPGPIEVAILVAIALLLFGPWWLPRLARRFGEIVGATGRSDRAFREGREGG